MKDTAEIIQLITVSFMFNITEVIYRAFTEFML